MAIFRGDIRSAALAMDTQLYVILPYDRPADNQQKPCRVLYLLHGLGDNAAAWTRYTGIERYARERGLAVIMPEAQRSFYMDMEMGLSYFTYVTLELPDLCAQMFHISSSREDTFVAGLSMGGFGALKCGLSHPELYAGCASFSGVGDLSILLGEYQTEDNIGEMRGTFGPELIVKARDDLRLLANQAGSLPREQRPRVLITCGTRDFLHESNRELRDYLRSLPLDFRYEEWEGDHEWGFWDKSVQIALEEFFPENA